MESNSPNFLLFGVFYKCKRIHYKYMMEVRPMYIYGYDYIKYLNDDSSGLLTYDQWKNKNSLQASDLQISSERVETKLYKERYSSQSLNQFK